MPSVARALADAKALGLDGLDAQVLLAHCIGQPRTWLLAHREAELTQAQQQAFAQLSERRAGGEPLAYLVGEKEFHGLVLRVDSRVLVPRPETELLVEWGLDVLSLERVDVSEPNVLDLGTGSGAIALAVKAAWPAARVVAVDSSAGALQVARANATRLALDVDFVLSDWWQALAGRRFDLVLCNPPYVGAADPHLHALRHEPISALTSGASGFEALFHVIEGASDHLVPGGWLLLEHGDGQGTAVRTALQESGFSAVESRPDLAGIERCTAGSRESG